MPAPAKRIDAYLSSKGSPLAGYGAAFVRAGRKYGVDPMLLVAISGQETSFGKYGPSRKIHNAWGWGPHIRFGSWEEGIDTVARGLSKGYIKQGLRTIGQISTKWAPVGAANDPTNLNQHWVKGVERFYAELGAGRSTSTVAASKPAAANQPVRFSQPAVVEMPGPSPVMQHVQEKLRKFTERGGVDEVEELSGLTEAVAATPRRPVSFSQPQGVVAAERTTTARSAAAPAAAGGWLGSEGLARGLADIGTGFGLRVTSEKRARRGTKSGNRSDHWTGSKDSYAFDLSNGSRPTREMDRAAVAIAARLGVEYDGRGPLEVRKVVNGYRIQVLYRTNTGGNHYNHLHIGVRKVRSR